ncbi:hypothetical protein KGF56_000588 [Candida oxycetoniae]|uniref:Transcription factor TFIIIC triple barrel domain-containing protein n=1 Tax=Candida oxycetoniae TaxID=497107 RepID=A0AAI9WZK2_9ASCO|nr:uncharacterized protein KGF56_000588 [Candida oxycetoniae]KAI3406457.2 hypothetical protein KGF56_000588 [Candida oxycetoniae]
MTIKGIYIARHGYRSNWLPPPHPPNPTGIDSDPPLAPHGVNQAKQLAAYLVSLPEKDRPQFILTSPFYRCVETAEPIAKMLDIKIGIDRGIGEWFKKNRKIIPKPADYSDLNKFFHDVMLDEQEWPRDHLGVTPNSEGETTEEILERARKFWSVFVTQFEKKYPEIKNILLVTHAATMIALGSALLQLNTVTTAIDENQTMLRAGACSLTKYIRDEEARGGEGEEGGAARQWNIVMNGNCEFLTNGEEMNWDFTTGVEAGSTEDIARRKKEAEEKAKLNEYRLHNNLERENTPVADTVAGVSNEDEFEVRK